LNKRSLLEIGEELWSRDWGFGGIFHSSLIAHAVDGII
jgi:hypothetical protein